MKIYELVKTQVIDSSIDNVFDFFAKPENLKTITPEKLSFNIITPTPITMDKGTVIDYTIRLFGIQVHCLAHLIRMNPESLPPHQIVELYYSIWRGHTECSTRDCLDSLL